MGRDGNSVFQGAIIGFITQMKKNVVPFMMGILCFVHPINWVVLVLSKLDCCSIGSPFVGFIWVFLSFLKY
jgi:hypothetical protein